MLRFPLNVLRERTTASIWNWKHCLTVLISSNGLSATGIWLKAISAPSNAPITLVLADEGYKAAGDMVSEHINRGEQVLALDLLFNGATAPEYPARWEMLATTTGDRPLGLQAAQLLAVANWLRTNVGPSGSVVTEGIRNQVIAVTSAALEPTCIYPG
jgi:hypothetical protein